MTIQCPGFSATSVSGCYWRCGLPVCILLALAAAARRPAIRRTQLVILFGVGSARKVADFQHL